MAEMSLDFPLMKIADKCKSIAEWPTDTFNDLYFHVKKKKHFKDKTRDQE